MLQTFDRCSSYSFLYFTALHPLRFALPCPTMFRFTSIPDDPTMFRSPGQLTLWDYKFFQPPKIKKKIKKQSYMKDRVEVDRAWTSAEVTNIAGFTDDAKIALVRWSEAWGYSPMPSSNKLKYRWSGQI